jgi:pimeloyl-ACP methyl ester carboxylesterase
LPKALPDHYHWPVSARHNRVEERRAFAISTSFEHKAGVAFGTLGYVTVVPDYLGFGDSPGYPSYIHAKSMATCVVDALRAARNLCASNQITLNGQLFLFGYSQGGQATMATHRELETYHTNEFSVTASAPSAGAYDVGGVTVEAVLTNRSYPTLWYFPIVVASFLPIYNLAGTLEGLLAEPYRRTLPPLLDGAHSSGELTSAMPSDPIRILRPDFQADYRTTGNNH